VSDSALPNLTSSSTYALLNAYQATTSSIINLKCTFEASSTFMYAYIHVRVSDSAPPNLNSALPNLTSSFTYALLNAYQATIPSHNDLPCTFESITTSIHATVIALAVLNVHRIHQIPMANERIRMYTSFNIRYEPNVADLQFFRISLRSTLDPLLHNCRSISHTACTGITHRMSCIQSPRPK